MGYGGRGFWGGDLKGRGEGEGGRGDVPFWLEGLKRDGRGEVCGVD